MDYEILYKCEAEQNIKCYVCKANLSNHSIFRLDTHVP